MELEIKKISKRYGKKIWALKDISLLFEPGVYGLLGPNGAGKSTLIQIITGNLRPTSGEVLFNHFPIQTHEREYKSILGYVPQSQGMYDTFSARQFLEYMAALKGIPKKEVKDQVESVLETVGLYEKRNLKLGTFSGGMRQRILISQALLGNPKIIVLDEPTAGLDPQERIKIRNFISRIAEDKIILIATHVVSDVESIAKEIILLGKGEVYIHGTPEALCCSRDGRVFELLTNTEEISNLEQKAIISNLQELPDGRLCVRLVSREGKEEQWASLAECKVFPNLQEVYLSVFEEKKEVAADASDII